MDKTILVIVVAILAIGFWIFLGPPDTRESVRPAFDRTGLDLTVRVYLYDTPSQVTQMYRQLHNIPRGNPVPRKWGFAMWPEWQTPDGELRDPPPGEELVCEIHSIRPTLVDDNATLTLGHELLHCLKGNYHRF